MILRVGYYVSITSTNKSSSHYGFVTRINDDNMIEVKLTIGTTIRKIKKDDVNAIPLHSITGPFRTRSNRILLPSIQPTPNLTDENTDNQQVTLSFEKVMSDSLGWKFAVCKVLPLATLLLEETANRRRNDKETTK